MELVGGDDALLGAGAPPSDPGSEPARVLWGALAPEPVSVGTKGGPNAGDVVRAALGAQVRALQEADVLLRTAQPDAVHRMRVACRRLRCVMASFRSVLQPGATDALRAELRWLGLEMGGARDDEVALRHLSELLQEQPADLVLGPVAARVEQARLRQEQVGAGQALATLQQPRYLTLLDGLYRVLAEPPFAERAGRSARPVLNRALNRSGKRLRRRIDAARATEVAGGQDPLHEVRKAVKRVRYTAEVAAPRLGTRAAAVVPVMEQLQDVLGERQDSLVTRDYCRRLGIAAAGAGENAGTYRRLYALEEERAARAERDFWARWRELDGEAGRGSGAPITTA